MIQPRISRLRHAPALVALLPVLFVTSLVGAAEEGTAKLADGSSISPEQLKFFNGEVLPLLTEACFKCHGGEAKIRGGLNMTTRAGLIKGGDFGPAISFDKPEKSLLLEMISYKDDEHQMPPKAKLKPEQIDILTKWVKMGSPYPADKLGTAQPSHEGIKIDDEARNWWAYRKLTRPEVPAVQNKKWIRNPIDAFILARLEKSKLSPVAPAGKIALLRRAYYDLIGLPPAPAQIDAFVADSSPDAYEKVIDQLLAMPQYGEKWGRHWLDLVRFAETNGYERDGTKPFAWRYRDYVISAFNQDKPYDQFLLEQLAGDEIENPTLETITATGFYRLGIWDDEPADRPQARFDVLDDIVSTTSQVMLGMTVGCARCHDHKKDPIPQTDYYRLLAFFGDVTDYGAGPTVEVATPDSAQAAQQDEAKRRARTQQIRSEIGAIEDRFLAAADKSDAKLRGKIGAGPGKSSVLAADSREKGQEWRYTTKQPEGLWNAQAYDEEKTWKIGEGGFGVAGTPGAVVRTQWNTSDIWMRRTFGLKELPSSLTLRIHHDEDAVVYINGKQVGRFMGYQRDYITVPIEGAVKDIVHLGSNTIAVHCKQTGGGQYIDVGLVDREDTVSIADLIKTHGEKLLSKADRNQYVAIQKEEEQIRKQPPPTKGMPVLAVKERGQGPTHVLLRGSAHAKGDEVKPGFPAVLGFPDPQVPKARNSNDSSGKRLVLAKWMTSNENPMPARAMANRLWQHHFGRGLARTSNDFGKLGEQPTHPELLDWLAAEFQSRSWSMKQMHKLIMMSAAYQLSSSDDSRGLQLDPGNDLFWRYDMRRLTSEEVRDSILAVNGSLNLKMGGPSIYTEVPQAVLQTSSQPKNVWGKSPPDEQRRRSVYIFIKRSLVEPILSSFDLADTDSSCAVRFATTVPTQALTSLNSDFFNKQAALLAQRLKAEAGAKLEDQMKLGLRLVTGRVPTDKEISRCVTLFNDLQNKDGIAAEKALDYVCLVLINLNEFVYLD